MGTMAKDNERHITVAGGEAIVARIMEEGNHAGYVAKTVPSGTLAKEFFSDDGRSFAPLESRILDTGN